jgi:cellulose synthase/poly-beta-1,6-N-acetylglucosamine synthase-like glycosyltransferase
VIDTIGVVIPARDEETLIGQCLNAVCRSRDRLREQLAKPPEVQIVVALDACTDDTAAVVSACPDVLTISVWHRSVGSARAAGVRHLLRQPSIDVRRLWLANTDADSEVPLDWLSVMCQFANAGVDVVLGNAIPQPRRLSAAVERAWFASHQLGDGHRHVHGANLGIRADAYLSLGGWTSLTSGEDIALATRADAAALRVVRTGTIPVRTSARMVGRAPEGFAAYLSRSVGPARGDSVA